MGDSRSYLSMGVPHVTSSSTVMPGMGPATPIRMPQRSAWTSATPGQPAVSKSMPTYMSPLQLGDDLSNTSVFDNSLQPRGFPRSKDSMPGEVDYFSRYGPYGLGPSGTLAAPGADDFATNHKDTDPWFTTAVAGGPTRSPPKKGKSAKKADGKQPTFLTKLYQILEQPEYHHIIRWDDKGEIIIIERPDELAARVLPLVYRQSRFASFSRQLNIYGWMRKVSLRHVETDIIDPDASTWSHGFLRRDSSKEQILSFKRRVPPRPSQAQKNAARLQNELLSVSSDSDSFHSPPDAYPSHVLADLDENKPVLDFTPPHTTQPLPGSNQTFGQPLSQNHRQSASMSLSTAGRAVAEPPTSRRFSMPASLRPPINVTGQRSMSFLNPAHTMQRSMASQSAPSGPAFPTSGNTLQIVQGNTRPRAQGSGQSFSPSSSMNGLWLGDDPYREGNDTESDLWRGAHEAPNFRLDDPSSWGRRGFGTLGEGIRPRQPPPTSVSGPIQTSLQQPSMPMSQFGFSFTPMNVSPITMPATSTSQAGSTLPASGLDKSSSEAKTRTPTSAGGSSQHQQPQTVSPGIYQAGFALPTASMTQWRISPREAHDPAQVNRGSPMVPKHERRQSVGPYSPPRAPEGLTSGAVRGVGTKREPPEPINTSLRTDDDGLPSASLGGQPQLFGGQLAHVPSELGDW